jgi:hypothetical protein
MKMRHPIRGLKLLQNPVNLRQLKKIINFVVLKSEIHSNSTTITLWNQL